MPLDPVEDTKWKGLIGDCFAVLSLCDSKKQ